MCAMEKKVWISFFSLSVLLGEHFRVVKQFEAVETGLSSTFSVFSLCFLSYMQNLCYSHVEADYAEYPFV